jgi:hypothetical protein
LCLNRIQWCKDYLSCKVIWECSVKIPGYSTNISPPLNDYHLPILCLSLYLIFVTNAAPPFLTQIRFNRFLTIFVNFLLFVIVLYCDFITSVLCTLNSVKKLTFFKWVAKEYVHLSIHDWYRNIVLVYYMFIVQVLLFSGKIYNWYFHLTVETIHFLRSHTAVANAANQHQEQNDSSIYKTVRLIARHQTSLRTHPLLQEFLHVS